MVEDVKNLSEWQKILQPDIVKTNLILASLYLTAYEILRESICDRIKDFFSNPTKTSTGWEFLPAAEYKNEVLNAHKDLICASCLWLKKMSVLCEDDIKAIEAIRNHRNEIAHELPKLLSNKKSDIDTDKFLKMRELLFKIERWWIVEFEMAINEDFDTIDVDVNQVLSGPMMLLDHLISVVTKEA